MKKLISCLVVFSLICLTACGNEKQNGVVPAINDTDESITTFGVIKCHDTKDIVLPFNAGIEKVLVSDGERVIQGQKLIQLDINEYDSQINKKKAEIDDLERQTQILEDKLEFTHTRLALSADNEQNEALINLDFDKQEAELQTKIDNLRIHITYLQNKLTSVNQYIESETEPELEKLKSSLKYAKNKQEKSNINLSIDAMMDNLKNDADDLQLSIQQSEDDFALLEKTLKYMKEEWNLALESEANNFAVTTQSYQIEIGELHASIQQNKGQMALEESSLSQMRSNLKDSFIRNGCIICDIKTGIVHDIKFAPGDTASAGSVIVSLVDSSKIYIEVDIEEQSISGVKENALVHIIPESDKSKFYTGKISFISAMASEKNGETMITVHVAIDDADDFLIRNANVKVEIISD